jgi:hypothetical protein
MALKVLIFTIRYHHPFTQDRFIFHLITATLSLILALDSGIKNTLSHLFVIIITLLLD